MLDSRIMVLDTQARAVAPIHGLARLGDGSVRIDFNGATAQQQTDAGAIAAAFDWGPRKPRSLYAIWQQLNSLTTAQQNNIWTNITTGTPPKWALHQGPNAAAVMSLHWCAVNSGASAANLNDAKRRLVAMYCQDVAGYLVNPAFDATINVPGDEAAV